MIAYNLKTRPRLVLSEQATKMIARYLGFEYDDDSVTAASALMDHYRKNRGLRILNDYTHTHTGNAGFRHIVIDGEMEETVWDELSSSHIFRLFAKGMVKFTDADNRGVILKEMDKTIHYVRLTGHSGVDNAISLHPEMSDVIAGAFLAGQQSA